ncbi:MAG: methionyl-tRNA formyltransferase [Mesorhizobium amorphae]|nr:MAG: methionyl-tRNA formyltransferase [Mesorhizobium amorphae]
MLRIVFMGTPDFSVPTLRALHEAGHAIPAVYSQPPRPAGRRGLELVPSPVAREVERLGLAVHTPVSLKEEAEAFRALDADLAVVVAYGLLLPPAILDVPRLGCINGHASLLPRWRGAAPIQRAIMAGDRETGTMVMRMERGLDTGPVGLAAHLAIGPDETAGELHDRLSQATAELMVEGVAALERGTLRFTPQPDEGVTYAAKIDKGETRVDWSRPAVAVHNHIRALAPFPGAWTEAKGERLKILRSEAAHGLSGEPGTVLDEHCAVACGDGAVRLVEVQRAGGKAQGAAEFLRGARLGAGDRLG